MKQALHQLVFLTPEDFETMLYINVIGTAPLDLLLLPGVKFSKMGARHGTSNHRDLYISQLGLTK